MKGFLAVVTGIVVFIVAQKLLAALVTGTDTGSTLLITILPIAIAIGTVMLGFRTFLSNKED